VLAGVVAGRTNGEIGRDLYTSVKTVSVHVSNILRELDVPHRQHAARLGYRLGLAEHGAAADWQPLVAATPQV
jgi:DNA-binding NarL/FixJ family response regulator